MSDEALRVLLRQGVVKRGEESEEIKKKEREDKMQVDVGVAAVVTRARRAG